MISSRQTFSATETRRLPLDAVAAAQYAAERMLERSHPYTRTTPSRIVGIRATTVPEHTAAVTLTVETR